MRQSLCIVGCTAHKQPIKAAAEQLYSSELFFKSRRYAQAHFDSWAILSAKHGLLLPSTEVEPYDQALTTLTRVQREKLVQKVRMQIAALSASRQLAITSICGREYDFILSEAGISFETRPEFSLSMGKKLKALARETDPLQSEATLDSVYRIVHRLQAVQGLGSLSNAGQQAIPNSGVYLFFDTSEPRLRDPTKLRIVRVGTHGVALGSRASLRNRIRTHLGTSSGEGNHRSSIFRLHVGRSLMRTGAVANLNSWGSVVKPTAETTREAERKLERSVSHYLARLLVLFVAVPGESDKSNDRAYLEQNLIALLSNGFKPLDPPSHGWLGSASDKKEIRKSGLWNVNHTDQRFDPEFVSVLRYYSDVTMGKKSSPRKQIAPAGWLTRRHADNQLTLL